jgi:hypothetical protein
MVQARSTFPENDLVLLFEPKYFIDKSVMKHVYGSLTTSIIISVI